MQSRAYRQTAIFKRSQKLFDLVSFKIKTTLNYNKFFFAKSSEIDIGAYNGDRQLIYYT